jgi:hypothetical protein
LEKQCQLEEEKEKHYVVCMEILGIHLKLVLDLQEERDQDPDQAVKALLVQHMLLGIQFLVNI